MPLSVYQRHPDNTVQHLMQAGCYSEPRTPLPLPGEMSARAFNGSPRFVPNFTAKRLREVHDMSLEQLKKNLSEFFTGYACGDYYVEESHGNGLTDLRVTFLHSSFLPVSDIGHFESVFGDDFLTNEAAKSMNYDAMIARGRNPYGNILQDIAPDWETRPRQRGVQLLGDSPRFVL